MTTTENPDLPENPEDPEPRDNPPRAGENPRPIAPEPVVIRENIGEKRAEDRADQKASEAGKFFWPPWRKPSADIKPLDHYELGWRIFRWLIVLTGLLALLFAAFAYATYPRFDEVTRLLGEANAADPLKAYRELRQEWIGQMVTVGQMVVFGSLIPLVATTVGYLLGQGKKDNGNS